MPSSRALGPENTDRGVTDCFNTLTACAAAEVVEISLIAEVISIGLREFSSLLFRKLACIYAPNQDVQRFAELDIGERTDALPRPAQSLRQRPPIPRLLQRESETRRG